MMLWTPLLHGIRRNKGIIMHPKNGQMSVKIIKVSGESQRTLRDVVTTEEPLEIRLQTAYEQKTLAITMRTPTSDFELVAGFLYTEGIITSKDDIHQIRYCVDCDLDETQRYNVVTVQLRRDRLPDMPSLERHFYVSSACGVCGKTSIDALEARGLRAIEANLYVSPSVITSLPDKLRDEQRLFETTGGLHAVALFTKTGEFIAMREDVGRHNALDKLIGWAVMQDKLPLSECILLVSGRASYELVQKAVSAGIPIMCAISAPSSLAIDLARRFNLTLIGFLRGDTFNLYCGDERIRWK